MTGYFVDELFQSLTPVFNELLLIQSLIGSEWHLSLPCLARQGRDDDLTVPFQL